MNKERDLRRIASLSVQGWSFRCVFGLRATKILQMVTGSPTVDRLSPIRLGSGL